jgi:hypothetical protein
MLGKPQVPTTFQRTLKCFKTLEREYDIYGEDEFQTWELQAPLANWSLVSLDFNWKIMSFELRKFCEPRIYMLGTPRVRAVWQVPDTFKEP